MLPAARKIVFLAASCESIRGLVWVQTSEFRVEFRRICRLLRMSMASSSWLSDWARMLQREPLSVTELVENLR